MRFFAISRPTIPKRSWSFGAISYIPQKRWQIILLVFLLCFNPHHRFLSLLGFRWSFYAFLFCLRRYRPTQLPPCSYYFCFCHPANDHHNRFNAFIFLPFYLWPFIYDAESLKKFVFADSLQCPPHCIYSHLQVLAILWFIKLLHLHQRESTH